jgi:hypothetical protein
MHNYTQVQFTNNGSTSYISITYMIYNQTTYLVLYIATYMEDVILLAKSSTATKTNIL